MRLSDFNVDALSKPLRLPRETHFWNQQIIKKMFWDPGVFTVSPSKSLSPYSLVQILRRSIKTCPDAAGL